MTYCSNRLFYRIAGIVTAFCLWMALPVLAQDVPKTEAVDPDRLFSQNFEKLEDPEELPDDFMVLDGDFQLVQDGDNTLLRLPGAPLSTYSLLFGPADTENVQVKARARSESQKRRMPRFGIGSSGVSGYKLRINAALKKLELVKGEETVNSADYKWKSGSWTVLLLRVRKTGEASWVVEGKAWPADQKEPEDWLVVFEDSEEPLSGRPSLWGTPYSGKQIDYDDLEVRKVRSE